MIKCKSQDAGNTVCIDDSITTSSVWKNRLPNILNSQNRPISRNELVETNKKTHIFDENHDF